MKSLHIEGRRWFQHGPGNTYHSVRIFIDGALAVVLPYQYGYGDQFLQTALDWLRETKRIPARVCDICSYAGTCTTCPNCIRPTVQKYGTLYLRETLGGTCSVIDVTRKGDL